MIKKCNFQDIVSKFTGSNRAKEANELFSFWNENLPKLKWECASTECQNDFIGTLAGFWETNTSLLITVPEGNTNKIYFTFYVQNKWIATLGLTASQAYINKVFSEYIKDMETLVA